MSRAGAGALALLGLLLGACATLAPREDFARVDFELLGFLYHCGFEPSERLALKVGVKS